MNPLSVPAMEVAALLGVLPSDTAETCFVCAANVALHAHVVRKRCILCLMIKHCCRSNGATVLCVDWLCTVCKPSGDPSGGWCTAHDVFVLLWTTVCPVV